MKTYILFVLCLLSQLCLGQEVTYRIVEDQSEISYSAKHKLHAWKGVNNKVKGVAIADGSSNELKQLAILVKVADFNSDNANRDAHALEVLHALEYPSVKFYAKNIDLNKNEQSIKGTLEFHGISKEVAVELQPSIDQGILLLKGSFELVLSDYQIELPKLMFVPIEDLITLEFSIVLTSSQT